MENAITYIKSHWGYLMLLPGNLLALDAIIRNAAEAHGYTKTATLCRKLGNFLSFLTDILGGFLSKKQPPTMTNGVKTGG